MPLISPNSGFETYRLITLVVLLAEINSVSTLIINQNNVMRNVFYYDKTIIIKHEWSIFSTFRRATYLLTVSINVKPSLELHSFCLWPKIHWILKQENKKNTKNILHNFSQLHPIYTKTKWRKEGEIEIAALMLPHRWLRKIGNILVFDLS